MNNRLQEIPEEKKANTHYNQEDLTRRLEEYKMRHDEAQGAIPLISFFTKRQIEVLTQAADTPEADIAKSILDYIEKVSFI